MEPPNKSGQLGELSADELIVLQLYRRCSQETKDDIRRFCFASWRQGFPTKPTNVVKFPTRKS
jgi:hypothetical protein